MGKLPEEWGVPRGQGFQRSHICRYPCLKTQSAYPEAGRRPLPLPASAVPLRLVPHPAHAQHPPVTVRSVTCSSTKDPFPTLSNTDCGSLCRSSIWAASSTKTCTHDTYRCDIIMCHVEKSACRAITPVGRGGRGGFHAQVGLRY